MNTLVAPLDDFDTQMVVAREVGVHWTCLLRLGVCVLPAVTALYFGHLMLGARYLAISIFVMLGYLLARGDKYQYLALAIGVLPALSFFREVFFYSSILIFLGGGLLLWVCVDREEVRFVWKDLTWKCLVLLVLVYWWLSILYMGSYTANIRLLDCVLSATAIYFLADRRSWLATALIGVGISATLLAIALLPYGDRLGAGQVDGMNVGNPVLMGVPSAMILVLALADKGRLLLLEEHPAARMCLALISGEWLVLSGSRGSWTITLFCIILILMFNKNSRKALLAFLGVIALCTTFVLLSSRGEKIQGVFEKTIDPDRSLKTRTSFRSVQWSVMPEVFKVSPVWGWGPGSGKNVAFLYTGRHLAWHSLYLQIAGETGLIGLTALFWILGSLMKRSILHLRRWGEITPLIGIVAYMALGLSVSAFDAFSGILLGLALMSRERYPRFALREIEGEPESDESLPVSSSLNTIPS